jgi:hypothetical protein
MDDAATGSRAGSAVWGRRKERRRALPVPEAPRARAAGLPRLDARPARWFVRIESEVEGGEPGSGPEATCLGHPELKDVTQLIQFPPSML